MIDTAKLIPRSKPSSLPKESIINLNVIKKDVIEIDNLLKQRLVLRKVRDGILRQQEERRRRFARESFLEGRKKRGGDDGLDVDPKSKKPKSLVGAFISSVLNNLSVVALGKMGALFKVGKLLSVALSPKVLIIAGTLSILKNVLNSVAGTKDTLRDADFTKVEGNKTRDKIDNFITALNVMVTALVAGAIASRASRMRANRLAQLREDNIFKFGRLEQTVAKARKADDARAKADAVRQEEEAFQNRERARRKREQENLEFARDLRKREDVRQTEAMQRRAERNIQKEVGGQMVERGARTTTSVIDRSKGGGRIIKKNLFIIDPAEGFDVRSKMTSDGVEKFFLGDSNIRLNETDVGGRPVFEAQKSPALKRRVAKTLGIRPSDFNLDDVTDSFEIRSNLGVKARIDAGKDALLDEINMSRSRDFSPRQRSDMRVLLENLGTNNKFAQRTERSRQRAIADPSSVMGTGRKGSDVVSRGRVGSRQFLRPDGTSTDDAYMAALKKVKPKSSTAKITAKTLKSKGIRGFLARTVGQIPFLGDLIFMLIDIFVFGQPPGRAAFMAVGGALLGFLGGLLGSLAGPAGALALGILGGIGGDMLGGMLYDVMFGSPSRVNPLDRLPRTGFKQFIKGFAEDFKGLFGIAKKARGKSIGGFATFGKYMLGEEGREFVLDADSTASIERNYPGLLMALNKADYGGALDVLKSRAFYEEGAGGSERMLPVPIPIPSSKNQYARSSGLVLTRRVSLNHLTYSQLYRRG